MNTLGLLGGTSWRSTIIYYSTINEAVNKYHGNNTNPPLLVYTLNQAKIHAFQQENKWDAIAEMLIEGALSLRSAGAQAVMFCANTPHKVYEDVQRALDFPILHIADATAKAIHKKNIEKVCFLGTKYSMEQEFIVKRLADNGIEVYLPNEHTVIEELHRIIREELTYGEIKLNSKKYVIEILQSLINKGAQGVVLGCTEFPLMIADGDLDVPIFSTTKIHAMAGYDFIMNNTNG